MATMMYEPRKDDTRSRSYVRRPFAFLFFFPSPGAERRRLSGGAGAEDSRVRRRRAQRARYRVLERLLDEMTSMLRGATP